VWSNFWPVERRVRFYVCKPELGKIVEEREVGAEGVSYHRQVRPLRDFRCCDVGSC